MVFFLCNILFEAPILTGLTRSNFKYKQQTHIIKKIIIPALETIYKGLKIFLFIFENGFEYW